MGLDMYLYKSTYVKNWDHMSPEERHTIVIKKGDKVREDIKPERITSIREEVAYWRKFNALHKWFVDNTQDGEDKCQESYVGKDDLKTLLDILKKVKEDNSLADDLLPTQEGFFFGGTEYDEWYFKDVEETIPVLESLIEESEKYGCDFYYHSSW